MKTTIKTLHRRGITDLESPYAFHGASQGDRSCSNDPKLYATGWMVVSDGFKDVDITSQEAIDQRVREIVERNRLKVEELIANGTYGEEYETEYEVNIVKHPIFDAPLAGLPMESYRMVMLDASDFDNQPNIVHVTPGKGLIASIEEHHKRSQSEPPITINADNIKKGLNELKKDLEHPPFTISMTLEQAKEFDKAMKDAAEGFTLDISDDKI